MTPVLVRLVVRALACAGLVWLGWRWIGPFAVLVGAPVVGAALARPILDLLGGLPRLALRRILRHVDGVYFEYRGHAIDVFVDGAGFHWLGLDDVRRIVPHLPDAAVLCRLYPGGCRRLGSHDVCWRITAEALEDLLAKATEVDTVKFAHWLGRDIVRPSRNKRARRAQAAAPR